LTDNLQTAIEKSYGVIEDKAFGNMLVQGVSGLFGGVIPLLVDAATLYTHYYKMIEAIAGNFERKRLASSIDLGELLKKIAPQIVGDLIVDKGLGLIPIWGAIPNVICAKAMTWRIGILFSMFASRGETVDADCIDETMSLIKKQFPQSGRLRFNQPDKATFAKLVRSVCEKTPAEYKSEVKRMLALL
jgi:hypothetical protein